MRPDARFSCGMPAADILGSAPRFRALKLNRMIGAGGGFPKNPNAAGADDATMRADEASIG